MFVTSALGLPMRDPAPCRQQDPARRHDYAPVTRGRSHSTRSFRTSSCSGSLKISWYRPSYTFKVTSEEPARSATSLPAGRVRQTVVRAVLKQYGNGERGQPRREAFRGGDHAARDAGGNLAVVNQRVGVVLVDDLLNHAIRQQLPGSRRARSGRYLPTILPSCITIFGVPVAMITAGPDRARALRSA